MAYFYFFDRPYFEEMYNCSFYNVDNIPQAERRSTFQGVLLLVVGSSFLVRRFPSQPLRNSVQVLYIPCLYAMLRPKNFENACYKFMAYLGMR